MAKLKPDYIEWVLTLNASDAQKEIHNLSEKNKELRDSNKEIKKAMTDLIATGKAGGKQWKRLDEQLKENNKTIGENNKKIAECEKRLDKTTMSANQLARKANSLRKELRDTVKSLQPEKYAQKHAYLFMGCSFMQDHHNRVVSGNRAQYGRAFAIVNVVGHAAGVAGAGADNGNILGEME